jgi:hypothetical protein
MEASRSQIDKDLQLIIDSVLTCTVSPEKVGSHEETSLEKDLSTAGGHYSTPSFDDSNKTPNTVSPQEVGEFIVDINEYKVPSEPETTPFALEDGTLRKAV